MMQTQPLGFHTSGGNQSTPCLGTSRPTESEESTPSCRNKKKPKTFLATININSLLQVGKLKQTLDVLREKNVMITAVQETRFTDECSFESEGFRVLKGKPGRRVTKNIPHLGTGFIVNKKIVNSILDFSSVCGRLSTLSFKSINKAYTIVNFHAPTNETNKKDPKSVDKLWEKLEETIDKVPKHHSIILIGDFNAQIGKEKKNQKVVGDYPAHRRTNRNGERLIEVCRNCDLKLKSTSFKHLPRKMKTWKHPNPTMGEFQLDHVAISNKSNREILNVKVLRNANIDSDHYLSLVKMSIIPNNRSQKTNTPLKDKPLKIDVNLLKDPEIKDKFTAALHHKPNKTNWDGIKSAMIQSANETLKPNRKRKHPWWNEDCNKAIANRRQAWLKWNSRKSVENHGNFLQVRKETAKLITATKRKFNKTQIQEIQENFQKHHTREFYQTFKTQLTKFKPPTLHVRGTDGKLNLNDKSCAKAFGQYFSSLLNAEDPQEYLDFYPSVPPSDSPPPTLDEVMDVIRGMKNNKAGGEDGILAEMWKNSDYDTVKHLHNTITEIWQTETLPPDWTVAVIHPLHKKGDKRDLNNYRGISLLPVTYKILSRLLLNRMEPLLDQHLGEYQAGFRKSRSCAEQIHNLKSVIAYAKSRSKKFVVTFVDFQKAYDSINRETIRNTLFEFGLDQKIVNLTCKTLENTISKVKFRGELSEPFQIATGVRQGDQLSPLLFNCVLEKIIREWSSTIPTTSGIQVGYKRDGLLVNCLAFADDLALIANNIEEATTQISILQSLAAKTGLKIAFNKTEFISNIKDAPQSITIGQQDIKQSKRFKYLGEIITPDGSEVPAIESRCAKLEGAFHLCKDLYKSRSLSLNLKICHYNSVIRPSALYASETLNMTKKGPLRKLEIKDRKMLRKILGPVRENNEFRRRHNNELFDQCEDIITTMRKRRLMFFGHLERMNPARFTHRLHNSISNKKSYSKWTQQVKKDLQEGLIPLDDIHNRQRFRDQIKTCSFQPLTAPTVRPASKWSQERKEAHSIKMKNYWQRKKNSSRST